MLTDCDGSIDGKAATHVPSGGGTFLSLYRYGLHLSSLIRASRDLQDFFGAANALSVDAPRLARA